jgi:endoglucanase
MITRRTATALLLSAVAAPALAAGKAQAVKVPSRGFNLPDWLAPNPRVPAGVTLDMLHGLGFETIRLPVDPDFVLNSDTTQISGVLRTATDHGFNVIVDMHPGGSLDFDGDFDTAAGRLDDAWRALARIAADASSDQVYLELLNEPPMDPEAFHPLRDRLAETVRNSCPDHTLVWGPARYQGLWELDGSKPLADDNAIVAVHYYTPMGFTHQCLNWDDSSPLAKVKNLPFPATRKSPEVTALVAEFAAAGDQAMIDYLKGEFEGAWTVDHIEEDFATLGRWSRKHKTPMMLNEFGVLNFCVDATSRTNWVRAVRKAAERNTVGWTYWEADQGFGFISDRTASASVEQTMIEALLG